MSKARGVVTANDYIDTDVAYLLGMLFGRGQLVEQGDLRRLIITLDIRRKLPKLPPGCTLEMDLDLENERALNQARQRVNNLLDANVDIVPAQVGKTTLTAVFVKPTIAWRDLRCLTCEGTDRSDFQLNPAFVEAARAQRTILEEFVRGFADVAVTPSYADNAWGQRARVAFPVVHANAQFADTLKQMFGLLGLSAALLPGNPHQRGSKKEHRIRVYAEDYEPIGFHFAHKRRLLQVMADYNRTHASTRRT